MGEDGDESWLGVWGGGEGVGVRRGGGGGGFEEEDGE